MLARGTKAIDDRPARASLLLLCLAVVLLLAAPSATRADLPTTTDNGNASRTVTWNLTGASGLSVQNLSLSGGNASLPWQPASMVWNRPTDFTSNGTLPASMVANASGISLRANSTSYVVDGGFASPGGWTFRNGTTGNVTADWESSQQTAALNYTAASTEVMWDNLDAVNTAALDLNWSLTQASGGIFENHTGQVEGGGMMGINIVQPLDTYFNALRYHPMFFNWSSSDRLALWINAPLTIRFNVTAVITATSAPRSTVAQRVPAGWQDVVVNLSQLGTPQERRNLTSVALRFNNDATPIPANSWFYVDAIRRGYAKRVDEGSSVYQILHKANATTPLSGSALLNFDWCLVNATGVENFTVAAEVEGPGGLYASNLTTTSLGAWQSVHADISPTTGAPGAYNLSFRLWAHVNTTAESALQVSVDNVSLLFPERHNATYTSRILTMGASSAYVGLSWSAVLTPGITNVSVGIRSGNNTDPRSNSWSPWENFTSPGTHGLSIPGGTYFQVGASLTTSNASRTPQLTSLNLSTQHHLSSGLVESQVYPALGDILAWSTFNASVVEPPRTSVSFFVGNGSDWTQVGPGDSVSFIHGPHIQWKAVFSSSDGLATPSLHDVRVTYEYLGKPATIAVFVGGVAVNPGIALNLSVGQYLHFAATVRDAGGHVIPAGLAPIAWTTNDTKGFAYDNGTYLAGSPGFHVVNATVTGYQLVISIKLFVSASPGQPIAASLWDLWPAYAVAVAAAVGFGIYEFVIRRMFAIDDVFLIGKDGRLMIHNTRRMRADRDEDILSGMLTAIMSFLRDQDPEENGELKQFKVGGKTTLLERGRHAYLTAVYSGRVPRWAGKDLHRFMADLEARFGDAFAHWDGSPEDLHGIKEFMGRFVTHVRYRGARGPAN